MRAAAIFGLGTSPAALRPFQVGSSATWLQGLPISANDADAILIFGGDGTIHRHLPALVRLQLPALIVPAGSGNDFARALKLRSIQDSLRAWRDFEAGRTHPRQVDLGVIVSPVAPNHNHYFCTVAGCGLDSAVARRANRLPRWVRGHGGYALSLLPMLLRLPVFRLQSTEFHGTARTEIERSALLVAFANTQYYGDGMRIAPNADFSDGSLDICSIRSMNPVGVFCLFPTVYFGHHLLWPQVETSRTERVHLQTDPPLEIYADGEFVCETPAELSIARGALRVIMPG